MNHVTLIVLFALCSGSVFAANDVPTSLHTTNYAFVPKQNSMNVTSTITGTNANLPKTPWFAICPDSYTYCEQLGYKLQNGPFTYYIYLNGKVEVYKHGVELVFAEQGQWQKSDDRTAASMQD